MITVKSKILFLIVCFLEAIWLLLAQVMGNMVVLMPCLVFFLAIASWAAINGMVMPVLMFFLPFAPLLKIRPGTISFFTIALLVVYLIYIIMGSRNINIYHLIPGLVLIALALTVKTFYGYQLDASFILFSVSVLLIPFLTRELDGKYDFYWLTLFFAFGIAVAAITARYLSIFPAIAQYIETHSLLGSIRHSGYYGDPNFYSAHITAALSGVLVLLLNHVKKSKMISLIIIAMVLFYCGFMSVSKTFLLVTICLLLFWAVEVVFNSGRLSEKLMLILTFGVGVMFLLSATVFTDFIDMFISRFLMDNNLSDFTTRRTELWVQYLRAFGEDPLLLLFGKGYTGVLINDRASHNTILQAIYQFGLVGFVFFISWFVCYIRTLMANTKIRRNNLTQTLILLIGAFGPWMALDLLFFDEFFLLPIYVCAAIRFLTKKPMYEDVLI